MYTVYIGGTVDQSEVFQTKKGLAKQAPFDLPWTIPLVLACQFQCVAQLTHHGHGHLLLVHILNSISACAWE